MFTSVETTDGKFVHVVGREWWQTDGVDLVDEAVVDDHLAKNPRVGVQVTVSDE